MIAEAALKEENESNSSMVEDVPPAAPAAPAAAGEESEKKNVGSCSSDDAGGISCLELEAWMREDESMDCMMLLPEVPLDDDGDSPSTESMHRSSSPSDHSDQQLPHAPRGAALCDDEQCNHESSIFCRSSSSCSTTFPDTRHDQETLDLALPDDFFEDKQQPVPHGMSPDDEQQRMNLPGLTDRPRCCDLRKIIVKKPVMDKAVERLGGGRRGALRLWNIIQVWLRYQQQSGTSASASLDGFLLPNMGSEFLNPDQQQQQQMFHGYSTGYSSDPSMIQQQQQQQQQQLFPDISSAVDHQQPQQQQQQQLGLSSSNCSSAAATTRAARKSRMARQRRHRAGAVQPAAPPVVTAAAAAAAGACSWSSSSSFAAGSSIQQQQQFLSCRDKDSCDKSVKFLLQKELKPSDVGNLGRIVLPKKEAEVHLPYLSLREGITLAMEDMISCQVWHFRYRFWPNNKSRMYLLEGTGEYIKTHRLKEGDSLQIYRDTKSGKHVMLLFLALLAEVANLVDQQIIYGKKVIKHKPDDDCVSGVSTISEDAAAQEQQQQKRELDSSAEIERFPSVEVGDEFIEEILGMVDGEEASSPESCKEDN